MKMESSPRLAATRAAATFAALGSEQRLDVLLALVRAGPQGRSMGALAQRCGIGASTLTFHLKVLVQAGLVDQRREGRHILCTARTDAIRALSAFLMSECCAESDDAATCHPDLAEREPHHG